MAKFKRETEVIGTMYLTTKDKEIPVAELHSILEWKPVVAEPEMSRILSGERGQLYAIKNDIHHRNVQKLLKKQKIQLLWLAIKNLFK